MLCSLVLGALAAAPHAPVPTAPTHARRDLGLGAVLEAGSAPSAARRGGMLAAQEDGPSASWMPDGQPRAVDLQWWGLELQAYPAGVIPAIHAQFPVSSHGVVLARVGYNATDRGDWGEHDEEDGGGPGGGLGYRHYFGEDLGGWMLGGRVDFWSLNVDWEDDAPPRSGETDVFVIQPAVEGGYGFRLGERLRLDLALALGVEINARTDGESVGQGAILLGGAALTWGF